MLHFVCVTYSLFSRRSRLKNRKDTLETQMNSSRPDHDRCKAADVDSTEPLYENVSVNYDYSL